jgi:hypothetical protein
MKWNEVKALKTIDRNCQTKTISHKDIVGIVP